MASSLAKELCLSPALKTSSVRRRSLDICQQIGTQLLSPNLLQQLSPSSSPKTPSPTASQKSSTKSATSPFKLLDDSRLASSQSSVFSFGIGESSEQNQVSSPATYNYKRRASDSFWMVESLQRKVESFEKSNETFQTRRRSLTPQHPSSSFNKLRNKEDESCEESIEKIYPDESKHVYECTCDADVAGESEQAATNRETSIITCNIIPPTPLKPVDQEDKSKKKKMPPLQCSLVIGSSSDSENEEPEEAPKSNQRRTRKYSVETSPHSLRRCSAGAKYDLDENVMKLVALHLNLSLNPDELLGKGSFGTVIGGQYQGKQVAVKILKTTNAQRKASILGENNALNLPFHNHIARTMDIFQLGPDRALIIMEKMHKGNLLTLLNDPTFQMNCSAAINFSKQIALALIFCHRQGILHLDVKPQNILMDFRNCCKLSDFGSSKKISDLATCYQHFTLEGTVPYTAPELFRGACPTEKCDVYSFAITMWQILTREVPYEDENEHTVIFRVVSQDLRPGNNNQPTCSDDANEIKLVVKYAQLYEKAWDPDPRLRPAMTEMHKSLIEIQFFSIG